MKYTLAVLVDNQPGVLARVSGLFSRRGYNIESLAVGPTEDPAVSRMTIVVNGDEYVVEQVKKQLQKLISVIKVSDLSGPESVSRELALIKVEATPETRSNIMQIVNVFRANVVDVSSTSLTVEITGDNDKINALIQLLHEFGIVEMVRTGVIAVGRGRTVVDANGEYERRQINGENLL